MFAIRRQRLSASTYPFITRYGLEAEYRSLGPEVERYRLRTWDGHRRFVKDACGTENRANDQPSEGRTVPVEEIDWPREFRIRFLLSEESRKAFAPGPKDMGASVKGRQRRKTPPL